MTLPIAAGALIYCEGTQRVLAVTRSSDPGVYGCPGGKADPGESAYDCCLREVLEETGVNLDASLMHGPFIEVCPGETDYESHYWLYLVADEDDVTFSSPESAQGITALWVSLADFMTMNAFPNYNLAMLKHFSVPCVIGC